MAHKIKITAPGWETYTGEFAGADFVDGVSTDVVGRVVSDRIAALLSCETIEGEILGVQQRLIDNAMLRADVVEPLQTATEADLEAEQRAAAEAAEQAKKVEEVRKNAHTREDLEKIASEKGINGLRKVATPLGVKGRGINELIEEILKAEAKLVGERELTQETPSEPVVEPVNEPAGETPAPEGDAPEGDTPEGDAPESEETSAPEAPQGDAPEGDKPEGEGAGPESEAEGDTPDAPKGDEEAA